MEIPAEVMALTLLRPQLQAEELVGEMVTEPCETRLRSPTSNRPGESCWMPPGHEQGGSSWCPLSREASSEGERLLSLASWPWNLPVELTRKILRLIISRESETCGTLDNQVAFTVVFYLLLWARSELLTKEDTLNPFITSALT